MKIIVTDCDHAHMHEEEAILGAAGLTFSVEQCRSEEDVIAHCKGAEILINQYAPITRRVMEALRPELRQVVRYGVGVNNVDCDAATELGVLICNVPDYGTHEVSDHALALTLDLVRKVSFMNASVRAGRWNYEDAVPLFRLSEQVIGILGLGRNGRMFAEKCRHLFGTVRGYDPYYTPNAKDDTAFIKASDPDTIFATADIIVLHMPLTPQTRHIVNEAAMAKMKPTAVIVNPSRGGLVDEMALDRALAEKRIGGAALDVTEQEPIAIDSPLLRHPNLLCTPHIAWYSEQSASDLQRKVAEEAVRFARSEPCLHPVNKLQ